MTIPIYEWHNLDSESQKRILARATTMAADIDSKVREVLSDVRAYGDASVRDYTARFDGFDGEVKAVPASVISAAVNQLPPTLKNAMEVAIANIRSFHAAQMPKIMQVETIPGVQCQLQYRPIETVGLYIPGGSAPLFSTVLMTAIPAKLAGCKRLVLCSPPDKNGQIHPAILAAAHFCDVDEIFPIGGVQAVAAMAYGTQTVPKTNKIFGPGNAYVTRAKQMVAQEAEGAAIDTPAGPSEVLVVAEKGANAAYIASDLLAQAEHGPDSQAILITTCPSLAEQVQHEVETQLARLPRAEITRKALDYSSIILARSVADAIVISNIYAPEHLILHVEDSEKYIPDVTNAGSVFVGAYTPEPLGDYASGTNHVLPTYGYARSYGSLSLLSFMKSMTVQHVTQNALKILGPHVVIMAEAEGLEAHAEAVRQRLKNL